MAGAVIGALRVVLGADTAALDKGLKDSQSKLASFGHGMATAGVAVGVAMVAMGAAVATAVRHSITEADKLGKMAQKIGVPVEELSALTLAAALSDISMESLGKSVGKLSKAMVEAAAKPTSDAANAFKALGVTVTESDGKLKSSTSVISDIAGKFEGLKDGAGKTAVAMALFGKSGTEMIPLLNAGKAGLKEMSEEAAQLGLVIDKHTAKSAEEFNDNLTRLGKVKDGIILKISVGMLPALQNLSANMVRVAKHSDGLKSAGETVGAMMTGLFSIIEHVRLGWQRLGVEWVALREFMKTDVFSGKLTENWKKFTDAGAESTRQLEALRVTLETAHLADAFGAIGAKAGAAAPKLGEFNYAAMAGKTAFDNFIDSAKKSQAAQVAELATTDMATGAKERLRMLLQGLAIVQANSIVLTNAQSMALHATAIEAENLALKIQGTHLVQQNTAPLELYRAELATTEIAMRAVGATAEELARNQERVGQQFGMTWSAIGTNIAGTAGALSQLTGTFAKENKAMGVASKAFGISQAIINTQIAITKALATLPPPASYFAVALAVAQGAASIATISQQKFATGADFRIPGGIGGADNVPVSFMAQAGERVKVEPNRYGESDGGSDNARSATINLSIPQGAVRDFMRGMIDGINDLHSDGYRLKIA